MHNNDYKLVAEGLNGIKFRSETHLSLNEKLLSIFIQTDKAIYKPGDIVRFRVLVLDSNTKPAKLSGSMTVFIAVSKVLHVGNKSVII